MRFSLLRSRAFWLGVPMPVFLLWAWADSMKFSTQAIIMWKGSSLSDSVYHHAGSLDFIHWPGSLGGSRWPERCRANRRPSQAQDWFPMPGIRGYTIWMGTAFYTSRLIIPHWCMVSCYLILWSSLMTWRWWRFHRMKLKTPTL